MIKETFEGKAEYIICICHDLEESKMLFDAAAKEPFDIVICDGSLQTRHDGLGWIKELHTKGQKVITFSDDKVKGVPQMTKYDFDRKKLC